MAPAVTDNANSQGARIFVLDPVTDTWVPATGTSAGSLIVSQVDDGFGSANTQGVVIVSATPRLASVGVSNMAGRKHVIITPLNTPVYWSTLAGLTTATGHFLGTKETGRWTVESPSSNLYLIGSSTNAQVRVVITESL